jgi:hypothetical protein
VLPLLRQKVFSATGLIAGSIAPDFESFLRMRSSNEHSHTLGGMFYFDLPLSIIIALLFHLVVKESLIANSPSYLQQRFVDLRQLNFWNYLKSNYWIFLYSALVGSATHLLWDSFTHGSGFMAEMIPFINETKVPFQGAVYPFWYTLQHISSVIGLTLLAVYVLLLKRQSCSTTEPSFIFWLVMFFVAAIAFYLRYEYGHRLSQGNIVVAFTAALLLGLILASLLMQAKQRSVTRV